MCKASCLSFCSSWIRPILIVLYILFVIIALPLLIYNTVKDGFTKKDQLILIGGLFVGISFPICLWHIWQHVLHFTKPILQKPIIRILWMVPVYAINAVRSRLCVCRLHSFFNCTVFVLYGFFAVVRHDISATLVLLEQHSWMLRGVRHLQFYGVFAEFFELRNGLGGRARIQAGC